MSSKFAQSDEAPVNHAINRAILEAISAANSARDLHRIARDEIMSNKVMNEAQRLALWEAVSQRFCALNSSATPAKPQPRWG